MPKWTVTNRRPDPRPRADRAHPDHLPRAVNKETEHLMRGYAMGAVDYVFKPVHPMMLQSKVGWFVDLWEMRTHSRPRVAPNKSCGTKIIAPKSSACGSSASSSKAARSRPRSSMPCRSPCSRAWSRRGKVRRRFVGVDLMQLAGLAHTIDTDSIMTGNRTSSRRPRARLADRPRIADLTLHYRWTSHERRVRPSSAMRARR